MENEKNASTREIKMFTLFYNGMFWLKEENGFYPILIFPDDIALLFEKEEVVNMIDDDGLNVLCTRGYRFSKSTLICENRRVNSEYYDVEQNTIAVVPCHVKRT
jgi:hypothetical protein